MKRLILVFLIMISTIIYSDNLYMDYMPMRLNPSATAFNNYNELAFSYNTDTKNSSWFLGGPLLFFNLYYASEYNNTTEKLLTVFSSSMKLGNYLSVGGNYFNYNENNFGNIGTILRIPFGYIGYTYTVNPEHFQNNLNDFQNNGYFINNKYFSHSIQLGIKLGFISPFVNIQKTDKWNYVNAGLSLLNIYGFNLSYQYTRLSEENIHELTISLDSPNFTFGATSLGSKFNTVYTSLHTKRKRYTALEISNYWLKIKLDGPMPQIAKGGVINGSNYSFIDLLTIVRRAVNDDYVKGILFEIEKPSLSTSQTEELLSILKKGNKNFRVYLKMNSLGDYILATAANKSGLHPAVELSIEGPNIMLMFYRGIFDVLGVKPYFFKRANYKTAPEQYTKTEPTKYSLNELNKLVAGVKAYVELTIKDNTRLSNISELLDNAPYSAVKARKLYLVDEIAYSDEFENQLINQGIVFVNPSLYNTMFLKNLEIAKKTKIAVLVIEGPITEYKGIVFGFNENYREKILNSIEEIKNDLFVSGVIVRVESPGGSGFVADEINHALKELKKIKPVYASTGSMTASGGYYISVTGEKIFANKMSIVGSIGAYQGKFVIIDLIKKFMIGIFSKPIWKNGNLSSMFDKLTETQVKKMDENIDDFYNLFLKRVYEGRHIEINKLRNEIAGGRIYLGEESKKINLIDNIGGFYDTVDAMLIDKGFHGKLVIEAYPRTDNFLLNLFTGEKKLLFKISTMINLVTTPNLLLSDYEIDF